MIIQFIYTLLIDVVGASARASLVHRDLRQREPDGDEHAARLGQVPARPPAPERGAAARLGARLLAARLREGADVRGRDRADRAPHGHRGGAARPRPDPGRARQRRRPLRPDHR